LIAAWGKAVFALPEVRLLMEHISDHRQPNGHRWAVGSVRREGCSSLSKIRYAILEPGGDITIGLRAER
jgi:hypothetical protein